MRFRSVAILLAILLSASLFSQSERATVSGVILDATGAVIPEAKITLTNAATNVVTTATTNETGAFTLPNMPVGEYNLRVEKEGFKPAVRTGMQLNAASSIRADITLEIGTSTQAVEI